VLLVELYQTVSKMSQKMKLITLSEYNRLKGLRDDKELPDVGEKQAIFRKQHRADDLLRNSSIPDDIKADVYSNLLKTINNSVNNVRNIKPNDESDKTNINRTTSLNMNEIDKNMIDGFPVTFRWKAKYLLGEHLKNPQLIS
jgi:hypothetical protein